MGPMWHQTLLTLAHSCAPHVMVAVVKLDRRLNYLGTAPLKLGPIPIGGKLFTEEASLRDS